MVVSYSFPIPQTIFGCYNAIADNAIDGWCLHIVMDLYGGMVQQTLQCSVLLTIWLINIFTRRADSYRSGIVPSDARDFMNIAMRF